MAEVETPVPAHENSIPMFVRSDVDKLGLSLEAFRVYAHLVRRADRNGASYPSYATIGEACFRGSLPRAKADSLRRKAMRAVKELELLGVIERMPRRSGKKNSSNSYKVKKLREWPEETRERAMRGRS